MYWRGIALVSCSQGGPLPNINIKDWLWGHPGTSSMASLPRKIFFFGIIWDDLFISEVKVKLRFLPQFFSKWPLFWVAAKHFYRCNTASWINQQNSHEHLRYFKFLIDALAEILMEIKQFQIRPTLWPAESSMTSWIRIYSNLVIILWYLCTGSLMAISLFVLSYREKCFYFVYKGT